MSDQTRPSLADQLAVFSRPGFTPFDPETGEGLERADPMTYQRVLADGEYAAPGRRAEHEYGVLFKADHETLGDGMCRQARIHSKMLAAHMPLLLSSIHSRVFHDGLPYGHAGDDMLDDEVLREVATIRRTRIRNYLAVVYHTTIASEAGLKRLLVPEHMHAELGAVDDLLSRSIVYVPWERSTVPESLIEMLCRVGQVWLQCTRNVEVFVRAGLPRSHVRLIFPAYYPDGRVPSIPVRSSSVPSGKRFYNIGKWEPRKAQHELVGAFMRAYRPTDRASLTIKTSYFRDWSNYPGFQRTVPFWLEHPDVRANGWNAENAERRVRIYHKSFADEQMALLHEKNNVYVSAAHAEGWDYPAFDAKTAGNRLVHVGYGGSEDYASADDIRIAFAEGPVHPGYQWEQNALWAEYPHDRLVQTLREATPLAERRPAEDLAERFGGEAAGRAMTAALRDLLVTAAPDALRAAETSWRKAAP